MLTVQAWGDGGLTQHGGQRNEEKPTGSGYTLEVDGTGVDPRLKLVNREEKGRVESDLYVLGLINWKKRKAKNKTWEDIVSISIFCFILAGFITWDSGRPLCHHPYLTIGLSGLLRAQ